MIKVCSVRFLGEGVIFPGEYKNITVIGEVVGNGDIKFRKLSVTGEVKIDGNISGERMKVVGDVFSKGKGKVTDKIKITGTLKSDDNYEVGNLKITGEGNFKKDLIFNDIDLIGELTVGGNCEGTNFYSKGVANVDGLLSADKIEIIPKERSKINEIGGSEIIIRESRGINICGGSVSAKVIEGDKIVLQNTIADIVRGHDIKILKGCRIGKVEYTGSLTIKDEDTVGEKICLKN